MGLLKRKSGNVYCMIASDGEEGMGKAVKFNRSSESLRSLIGAGIKKRDVTFMHLPDTHLELHKPAMISQIEKLCSKNNVHTVFLPTGKDTHQDHRALYDAAISATRNAGGVLTYESTSSTMSCFSPTYFVGIDPYMKDKTRLLGYHKSQNGKRYMKTDCIAAIARYRGTQSKKARYAEAFEVIRITEV